MSSTASAVCRVLFKNTPTRVVDAVQFCKEEKRPHISSTAVWRVLFRKTPTIVVDAAQFCNVEKLPHMSSTANAVCKVLFRKTPTIVVDAGHTVLRSRKNSHILAVLQECSNVGFCLGRLPQEW